MTMALLSACLWALPAHACRCSKLEVADALAQADLAVGGLIIAAQLHEQGPLAGKVTYDLRITSTLKLTTPTSRVVKVISTGQNTSCELFFKVGQEYRLFLQQASTGVYQASTCANTVRYTGATGMRDDIREREYWQRFATPAH
ncbi:MAG: hypothetical protein WAX89_03465 [Alphaproteobacteria bacterium]